MDDWKKIYSNNDTEKVAIPYFWEHYDKENMSIWYGEYKYSDELKQVFMTSNLLRGENFFSSVVKLLRWQERFFL